MTTATPFNYLPTGQRLGRIRGDIDRAILELTVMGQASTDRPTHDHLAAAIIECKAALHALDAALAEVNKPPPTQNLAFRPAPGARWIPGEEPS